jgi:hypothetical protein
LLVLRPHSGPAEQIGGMWPVLRARSLVRASYRPYLLYSHPEWADPPDPDDRREGPMLRLTERHPDNDLPESYPFPVEAARLLRRGNRIEEARVDSGASTAARRVERALETVERRFRLVQDAFEGEGPDRPRAA